MSTPIQPLRTPPYPPLISPDPHPDSAAGIKLAAQRQREDPFSTVFLTTLLLFVVTFVFCTAVFIAISLSVFPKPVPAVFNFVFGPAAVLFGLLSRWKWGLRRDAVRERRRREGLLEKEEGRVGSI